MSCGVGREEESGRAYNTKRGPFHEVFNLSENERPLPGGKRNCAGLWTVLYICCCLTVWFWFSQCARTDGGVAWSTGTEKCQPTTFAMVSSTSQKSMHVQMHLHCRIATFFACCFGNYSFLVLFQNQHIASNVNIYKLHLLQTKL